MENPESGASLFTMKMGNEIVDLFDCAAGEDICTKEVEHDGTQSREKHEIRLEGGLSGKERSQFKVKHNLECFYLSFLH